MLKTIRPFFSVIIPCYNSRKTLGILLESIVKQYMLKNEIEVILADDCSTESYQDIVDQYKYKLNIKQTKTEYNCCPGNTRQAGVDVATGQWLIFADHDDEFFPNVFLPIKEDILKNNCNTVYISRFVKTDEERKFYREMPSAGWTHGKFFNKDNFWDKYHFHYIKDLTSHEDISISSQMNCVYSIQPDMKIMQSKMVTYQWVERSQSESNKKYYDEFGVQRPFLDVFYIDYIKSTAGVYYSKYKEGFTTKDFTISQLEQVMLYCYFYAEGNFFETGSYLKKNYQEVAKYLDILKNEFQISIDDIYDYFRYKDLKTYAEIFQTSQIATGVILYQYTFKQWLERIINRDF